MLKINQVTKRYKGADRGVKNITFNVNAGEIHAFIGPNGAGKTTLIKCIAGIHPFEEGDILIGGVSIKKDPISAKKMLACIPDNPDLYEYMTGMQFLNFIGDIFQVPANIRRERLIRYADAFQLTPSLGNLISTYSHGMKQKLAVISAFLHDPKLLILDEPFVGLDPEASVILRSFMREMCQAGGAILFSTHVLEVAEKLSDRVTIIKDGAVIKTGTMIDVVKGGKTLEDIFMEVAANGK